MKFVGLLIRRTTDTPHMTIFVGLSIRWTTDTQHLTIFVGLLTRRITRDILYALSQARYSEVADKGTQVWYTVCRNTCNYDKRK